MNAPDTGQLIKGIIEGDLSAFEEFFIVFQPQIFRFLYYHIKEKEAAEDLTQEVFIKFWEARNRLDPDISPVAYLFRIARNLGYSYVTDKKTSSNEPIDPDKIRQNFSEEQINLRFLLSDLENALQKLPPRCREVFLLSRVQGMRYKEIAETLDISLQTVKNQMNKALSILRKILSSY